MFGFLSVTLIKLSLSLIDFFVFENTGALKLIMLALSQVGSFRPEALLVNLWILCKITRKANLFFEIHILISNHQRLDDKKPGLQKSIPIEPMWDERHKSA